jgi:NTE family protein
MLIPFNLKTYTTLFLLLLNVCYAQERSIKNLVFEGAGIRGIAYAGVLEEFEKAKLLRNVTKVGGTSAGAIIALTLALGYNAEEINKIIYETNFNKFNDGRFIFFGGIHRIRNNTAGTEEQSSALFLGN